MNKFTILASAALLGLFSACSSDEPSQGNGGSSAQSPSALLSVNIQSADLGSRADNATGAEGDYEYGNEDENTITTGNFFFFDASRVYVAQAEVWNGGNAGTEPNVEYIGNQILVLKGLTEQNAPKYMVTVLNYKDIAKKLIAGVTTLDQFRSEVANYTEMTSDKGKKLFVMTTSSYNDGSNNIVGVTELKANDLIPYDSNMTDADVFAEVSKQKKVNVYVERLAAKYTFAQKDKEFDVTLTLAGSENNEDDIDNVARTTLKVTIDGFGIVNEADKSYLVKNMATPVGSFSDTDWAGKGWNIPGDYRCFWAKSVYFDNADATGLGATKQVAKVSANGEFDALYSNENTKPFATLQGTDNRVKANLITNVVFTATVALPEGASLVNYNGIYYKDEQFKKYVLKRIQETDDNHLNYYLKTADGTTSTTENPDGSTTTVTTGAKFEQIAPANISEARYSEKKTDASFYYKLNLAEGTKLYRKKTDSELSDDNPEKFEEINDGMTELNNILKNFFSEVQPTLFKGGSTYYVIPIEHLVATSNYVVDKDGQYGIVRNHWYNFTVSTISKLGHGVFDPSDGTNGDVIEITEDPKDPKVYGMSANVNLLSWKITTQNIPL